MSPLSRGLESSQAKKGSGFVESVQKHDKGGETFFSHQALSTNIVRRTRWSEGNDRQAWLPD